MHDSQFKPGTGVGPQGKMSRMDPSMMSPELRRKKEDKLLQRNFKQQERKEAKKRKKWGAKAEELAADEGRDAAQSFIEKKEAKFAGKETVSERVAGEVEDELRYIGGLKKPGYKKNKAALKKAQKDYKEQQKKK